MTVLAIENTHFLTYDVEMMGLLGVRVLKFRRCHIQNLALQVCAVNQGLLRLRLLNHTLDLFLFDFPGGRDPLDLVWIESKNLFKVELSVFLQLAPGDVCGSRRNFRHLSGTLDQPHDRVELAAFDARDGSQDVDGVLCGFVLLDRVVAGVVMLLVAQHDVLQQWALTRQEGARNFQAFSMPKLTLHFALLLHFWLQVLAASVQQEPHFGRHAKVADDQDAELLEERIPGQLLLITRCLQEVLGQLKSSYLHDVADVQILNPFVLVQKSKHTPHVGELLLLVI